MGTTVLVPVENHSRWARDVAEVVSDVEAEATEAVVLYVFEQGEVTSTRTNLEAPDALPIDDLTARKTGVSAAVDVLADDGIDVTPRGVREDDRPADAILDVARSVAADRIYLYARKRSPAGKAVFGSVVQEVILDAHVPVTVVPAGSV